MTNLPSILFRAYVFERIEETKRDLAQLHDSLGWRALRQLHDEDLPSTYAEMLALHRLQGEDDEDPRSIRKGSVFGVMTVFADTADCTTRTFGSCVGIMN